MRQAGWNELFAPRTEGVIYDAAVPREPSGWRRLFWWEDAVTFLLLGVMTMAIVTAITAANWVDEMPSLFPVSFFGLFLAALLARLRWPEGFIHLIALPLGAAAVLGQLLSILPGPTPWDRYPVLQDRMHVWFEAAFTGGISNDDLPFAVLAVSLSWISAYLTAWAVFRWRNAWIAILPGGGLLLANISFLDASFSLAFVVYLLCAALLVTRLHLLERAREWREESTPYPNYLSLSVLHATFWIALLLTGAAWLMPEADEVEPLDAIWGDATSPIVDEVDGLSRLFISVNAQKGGSIHDFEELLPLLGAIELDDTHVLSVTSLEGFDQPQYLRAQSYYIYAGEGWEQGQSRATEDLELSLQAFADREEITIEVISRGRTGDTLFTIGQPLDSNLPARFEWWRSPNDVTSIESSDGLNNGTRYETTGSVSVASEDALRAAGDVYPYWINFRYFQLPDGFPDSVRDLAALVTADADNQYDRAAAVESYLREIPYATDIPNPPPGQDPIEYFLFESRRGYFDYHASAMVLMLRSAGVPSRLAVGYVLDSSAGDGSTRYEVTEASAYAWAEVYFPGYGWVEFNPTPNFPSIRRAGGGAADGTDTSGSDDPFFNGLGFANVDEQFPAPEDQPAEPVEVVESGGGGAPWPLIIGLTAVAGGFAIATGGATYAWRRGLAGLEPAPRLWGQTVRLASWARLPADASQTPNEYARALNNAGPDLAEANTIAAAYVRHRYGGGGVGESERERLEAAWRALRTGLLLRLFRLR